MSFHFNTNTQNFIRKRRDKVYLQTVHSYSVKQNTGKNSINGISLFNQANMKIVGRLVWKGGKQKRGGTDADKFRTHLNKPIPMSIFHSITLLKKKI